MSKRRVRQVCVCLVAVAAALFQTESAMAAPMQYTGVNLSGAEFGSGVKPGTHGTNYIYPNANEVNYFVGKGMNVFRVPFLWERMQRTLGQPLYAQELQRLTTLVNTATAAGAYVVLDPHNYGKYNGVYIGSAGGPTHAQFADFWSRLATSFKGNDKVIFGLMNEPTQSSTQWLESANAAAAAIRATGATNQMFVPGVRWTGAHSWYSSSSSSPSNAVTMLNFVDPGDNYVFEVHQYLDRDSSGSYEELSNNNVNIGVTRLQAFTNWMKTNNKRGFLGEFAVPNSLIGTGTTQLGDEAINNMLGYMEANSDVWTGFAWWGGGPWWGNYMFAIDPTNLGLATQMDRPSMTLLEPHLVGVPEPTGAVFVLGALGVMALRRGRK